MKAQELIDFLKLCPPDAKVMVAAVKRGERLYREPYSPSAHTVVCTDLYDGAEVRQGDRVFVL